MIVYESTPNGVGNFFHKEYLAAKKGQSQFEAMFVAWFEIEQYELPFENEADKYEFAKKLFANRRNEEIKSDREEPGTYHWRLWEKGATLEAIHWYVSERSKYTNHGDMASEYPSDDIEAFTYSGRKVFSSEAGPVRERKPLRDFVSRKRQTAGYLCGMMWKRAMMKKSPTNIWLSLTFVRDTRRMPTLLTYLF